MKRLSLILIACFTLALLAISCSPASAPGPAAANKEPYKIGFTAAMTGPGAAGQLESTEGFRIYIETLNARGGIDGHPVVVTYEDDRAEGIKAVSNIKEFESLGVNFVAVDSLSSVYAGAIGEVTKANIPMLTFGIGAEEAAPPTPNRLIFSAAHGGLSKFQPVLTALYMTNVLSGGKPSKLAVLAADLPLARASGEATVKNAPKYGGDTIYEVVPMGMPDLTPIASKFIAAKADYLFYWGPGAPAYLIGDAMLKLGWKGVYVVNLIGGSFEQSMGEKWKGVENFVGEVQTVPAVLNLPEHKPIFDAAQKYSSQVPVDHKVVDGWLNGQIAEEILRRAGWPVDTEKILKVMNDFKLERTPLSAPIKWTAQDHIGDRWFGFYTWRNGKVVPVAKDYWVGANAAGDVLGAVGSVKDIKVK